MIPGCRLFRHDGGSGRDVIPMVIISMLAVTGWNRIQFPVLGLDWFQDLVRYKRGHFGEHAHKPGLIFAR